MGRPAAVLLLLVAGLAVAPARDARAQDGGLEYQVKAAFVHQFARFVEWPDGALSSPFRVCLAGADVFGGELHRALTGALVHGHPVVVETVLSPDAACHVLYIPDRPSGPVYLREARDRPILTIGETTAFLGQGGIIRLFRDGSHIRFDVNLAAAERARLRLSSRLIQLARGGGP